MTRIGSTKKTSTIAVQATQAPSHALAKPRMDSSSTARMSRTQPFPPTRADHQNGPTWTPERMGRV